MRPQVQSLGNAGILRLTLTQQDHLEDLGKNQ